MGKAEVLQTYGIERAGYVRLDFGGGDVLTVRGVSDLDDLLDDLVFI